VIRWDIDRYERLQDSAWEADAWAAEQDRTADRSGHRPDGEANRARARALRQQAAGLLAQYWAPLKPRAWSHSCRAVAREP
jgi:hypothetical protein